MRYRFEGTVGWPIEDVVSVQRDRVERLAAYLTGVEHVEVLDRAVRDGVEQIARRWTLSRDALPPGLRGLLPDHAMGFDDALSWDGGERAAFRVSPWVHADAVHFAGTLRLHDERGETLISVDGEFRLLERAAERLPPSLRAQGVAAIEQAVVAVVRAQLAEACRATERLLDDEA